jgi:hypothetical protein
VFEEGNPDGEEAVCQEYQETGPQGRAEGEAEGRTEGQAQRTGDREGVGQGIAEVRSVRRAVVETVPPGVNGARRRRRGGALLGVAALALLAWAVPAAATTVIAKSFGDLCAEADLVFVGTVTASESGWADTAKQAIQTRVTFGDLTWLRGTPRPSITLRFAGGSVDGLSEEIAGMPRFAVGDRVVMFARDGDYVSPIVGFHQGLYRVVAGAVVDAAGNPVTSLGGAALRRRSGDATPGAAMSVDEFVAGVKRELSASDENR